MSMTDEISMQTLAATNTALEQAIDKTIADNKYARPILILDGVSETSTATSSVLGSP